MAEDTKVDDAEIEQMAEARVEIEEEVNERKDELAKIGTFDTARCTEFEHGNSKFTGESKVVFTFKFSDKTIAKRRFKINKEVKSLQSFLDAHDADSVTDMIGAEHACIYTKSGWQLWRNPTVTKSLYRPRVSQDGSLMVMPVGIALVPCLVWLVVAVATMYEWVTTGTGELAATWFGFGVPLMIAACVILFGVFGWSGGD